MKKIQGLLALWSVLSLVSCGRAGSLTVFGSAGEGSGAALVTKALGSPTSLKVQLVSLSISTNADCSSPILVQDYGDSPVEFDLVGGPVLFTGSPADGTYNCVIITMEDTPIFTADTAAVLDNPICIDTTTEHTLNLYRDGESDQIDSDGNPVIGTGTMGSPGTDIITFAISTDIEAAEEAGFAETQLGSLENPLVIPGTTTFVFDFTDKIDTSSEDGDDYCWVEGPEVRFE